MKYQRGITLTGLMLFGVVFFLVGVLAVKVVPPTIEFYKIKKCITSTAMQSEGRTVPNIRDIYDQYANVDGVTEVAGKDLDIYKEGGSGILIVAFAYEKRIPLLGNASLLLDFKAEARK